MNAKDEFIEHIKMAQAPVKCVHIKCGMAYFEEVQKDIVLNCGFDEGDFNSFLKSLNFGYDNGYGGQELYGVIWYTDGTYSERGEYDGSEWWEYRSAPAIPEELL